MLDRFHVYLVPGAQNDFNELDGSVKLIVIKYLSRLKEHADTLGDPLRNDPGTKLSGCRRLKLREAGIRIIYRVSDEKVEVLNVILDMVTVLAIEKREDFKAYKIAQERLKKVPKATNYTETIKETLDTFEKVFDRFKK